MANQELITKLNEQLNREATTFLRYLLQASSIKGAQWHSIRDMYLEEVTDEVGHAQYLADQIIMLGGTPRLSPDLTPPPSDVRQMLANDSKEERTDVANYVTLAAMAEKAGLVALKMKMDEHAADEDAHAQEMMRAIG